METVHGLYWRKDGQIVVNPPAGLIQNLDGIPYPAHDLFKINRYTNLQPLTDGLDKNARAFTIMTSRGCPYKCTYCSKPITGDTWRARSVDNVIGEWRWLVRDLRATEIGLTDDIWNLKLDRAKELCRRIAAEGLNTVPWVTVHGMKVNHADAELFQLMKAAGCKRVGFGVESGDQQILRNVIKKSQTLDMVRNAFKWSKEAGLQTMGFFIFGMPQRERRDDGEDDPVCAGAGPRPGELHAGDALPRHRDVRRHPEVRQHLRQRVGGLRHPLGQGALLHARLRSRHGREEVERGVPPLLPLPAEAGVAEGVEEELLDRAAEHRVECEALLRAREAGPTGRPGHHSAGESLLTAFCCRRHSRSRSTVAGPSG